MFEAFQEFKAIKKLKMTKVARLKEFYDSIDLQEYKKGQTLFKISPGFI